MLLLRRGAGVVTGPAAGPQLSQLLHRRWLNVHEYQGAQLLRDAGVRVPPGVACHTPEEVAAAARQLGGPDGEVVLKSQVLAGGRGLGTFTNGLKGGVHIVKVAEAAELAKRMLGGTLVTKQTGPGGKPVNTLLVAKKMKLGAEKYFALLLDRKSAGPVAIACSQGGTSIEELAEAYPDRIVRVPIDPLVGMTDSQAKTIVDALQTSADKADAAALIKSLYKLFSTRDVTLLEVNPLAECEGMLMCADTKLNFDDNAAFRQKDVFAQRDSSQEDPREVAAAKYDLNFIALDGNIGCMVNGAGLAMATMDIIKMAGGSPANFLDVGGSANESQIENAFRILVSDPKVKCVLVNIFGGIMKCDVIANGIVAAAKSLQLKVPLVVRLEGTNVAEGKRILETSGMKIIAAEDLDDAARKAVASIRGK